VSESAVNGIMLVLERNTARFERRGGVVAVMVVFNIVGKEMHGALLFLFLYLSLILRRIASLVRCRYWLSCLGLMLAGNARGILKTKAFTGHRRSAVRLIHSTWPTGVGNRHVKLVDAVIGTIDARHRINHIKLSYKAGYLHTYLRWL
jgi:hypothetical protein